MFLTKQMPQNTIATTLPVTTQSHFNGIIQTPMQPTPPQPVSQAPASVAPPPTLINTNGSMKQHPMVILGGSAPPPAPVATQAPAGVKQEHTVPPPMQTTPMNMMQQPMRAGSGQMPPTNLEHQQMPKGAGVPVSGMGNGGGTYGVKPPASTAAMHGGAMAGGFVDPLEQSLASLEQNLKSEMGNHHHIDLMEMAASSIIPKSESTTSQPAAALAHHPSLLQHLNMEAIHHQLQQTMAHAAAGPNGFVLDPAAASLNGMGVMQMQPPQQAPSGGHVPPNPMVSIFDPSMAAGHQLSRQGGEECLKCPIS